LDTPVLIQDAPPDVTLFQGLGFGVEIKDPLDQPLDLRQQPAAKWSFSIALI